MKKIVFILFLISKISFAQYYSTGVEPFSTTWRQIKTEKFRIIFPAEAEKMANRFANLISVVDSIAPRSLHAKQKRFDIVIHNHSVLSNGFVAWAPKRMEVVATPPANTFSQPWLTQLAIHETRHTSQLFKLNSGLIRFSSFFLGEQAIGISAGFVPGWFFEGDAVAFETAISNSGRGRQASFYQYYRAHLLSNTKPFSYDKLLLGSYKNNIPNHYSLGYQMVSYTRLKYGDKVWENTLKYVSSYPFTLFPFYFGLKSETGLSRKMLFKETFTNLDSIWSRDTSYCNEAKLLVDNSSKEYRDYRYPFPINDSTVMAYKESLSRIPSFVILNTEKKNERILLRPGYLTSKPSYSKENIYWTEYLPHPRWEYKNYSIIKTLEFATGRVWTISDKGKYFSPVFNTSNKLIYAISKNDDGSSAIVAFSSVCKGKKVEIAIPQIYQPFELCISDDSNTIYIGVVTEKGKSILSVDEHGLFKQIYGPIYQDIHSISASTGLLFFASTKGYVEELFSYNILNNKLYIVYKSYYGSNDPVYNPKDKNVYFSNFTPSGYNISTVDYDTTRMEISLPSNNEDQIAGGLRKLEGFNIDSIAIPTANYKIEKYRGVKTLINVHSWAPFFFDPYKTTTGEVLLKPGVTLISQNLTGSSILVAGYGYGSSSLVHLNYRYLGIFPVFSYTFDLKDESPTLFAVKNTKLPSLTEKKIENELSLYIPLRLSANRYYTSLVPYFRVIHSNDYLFSNSDSLYHKGFERFSYLLYFSKTQRKSLKDISPRLGFEITLEAENAPFNKNNIGSLVAGKANIYLPGFASNHSFFVKGQLQNQDLKKFFLSNQIIFPRGYNSYYSEKYQSVTLEYLFPVAYPDWALGSIAYIKRFSINGFYEYAENRYPFLKSGNVVNQTDYLSSFGFELYTDLHLLRTRYPIRLKFQQGWIADNLLPFNSFSVYIDFYGQ